MPYIAKHHAAKIKAGKVDQAQIHSDGLDILDWEIDKIGKKNHLRAMSASLGFNVLGTKGGKFLSCTLNAAGKFTADYQLVEESAGGSVVTQFSGPMGEDLEIVIDTIGGMMQYPGDDDDHRHHHHGDRA